MGRKRASRTSLVRGSIAGSRNGAPVGERLALPNSPNWVIRHPPSGGRLSEQIRFERSGVMRRILLAGLVLFILAALSLSTLSLPSLSAAPRVRPPRGPLAQPAKLAADGSQ